MNGDGDNIFTLCFIVVVFCSLFFLFYLDKASRDQTL